MPTTVCYLLILCAWASTSSAVASRELRETSAMSDRHDKWMAEHGRTYNDDAEKARRLEIFKANIELIESFNSKNLEFKLAVNKFADRTDEELKAHKGLRLQNSVSVSSKRFKHENVTMVPLTVDWRKEGAVTPVKDQGQCGEPYLTCTWG